MSRKITSGPIHRAAKQEECSVVLVPEFVTGDDAHDLSEKIAIRRIKNNQISANVHFLSNTTAFIEFYFNVQIEEKGE